MNPRLLFAGTPTFAVPALRALIESGQSPLAVLTQPDRAAGRGRKMCPSPIKQLALDAGIDVLQPERLKSSDLAPRLNDLQPDLLITAAYGQILPRWLLALPRHGCWNLHASLLPRWRGASPINQAILHGDAETGVSLMQMEAGLDTGPVLAQAATAIGDEETAGELHDRLAPMAASLLLQTLRQLVDGTLPAAEPQDDARATHAPLISRGDASLDWQQPARNLVRRVRAFNPWPVAFARLDGLDVRIFRARAGGSVGQAPGTLVRGHGRPDAVVVACGEGSLEILELQAPARKRVTAVDWLNAHPDWR
ncbi:methionyl-tRNA formyltransferase [Wenzhouxiangella limi]|uniref:Methionyl-tRNA formyltransferase n=1 Tax=Wenzhouxiangella limi TaxID=2707351 RepID=A0A845UVN7_9GAMM|nr:methionyl-tRNA formyltransferase [Wenzhouxiangella limi]NDY95893.1 methionyl-tRNA formyltransferase [Wenzhouxiangella limi]